MQNAIKGHKLNNARKFPGISGCRPDKKSERIAVAEENLKRWQSLTPQQQLEELDRRLGKDVGAKKQRARIKASIEAAATKPKKAKKG